MLFVDLCRPRVVRAPLGQLARRETEPVREDLLVVRRQLGRSTTQVYAALFRQLRQQGTPIPINDLWIAALVVQHDPVLCTRDRHFQALPQLDLL